MNAQDVGIGAALTSVLGGGGFWAWLAARPKRSDLVKVAQDAAEGVIERLEGEIERLANKIEALEGKVDTMRQERHDLANRCAKAEARAELADRALTREQEAHALTKADCTRLQGRCEQLEGELRQTKQVVESARSLT